jgi:hypothetical protein
VRSSLRALIVFAWPTMAANFACSGVSLDDVLDVLREGVFEDGFLGDGVFEDGVFVRMSFVP